MKRHSLWAFHHPRAARLLIVLCYLVLNVAGLLIGDLLLAMDVPVSMPFVYGLGAMAATAFLLYPQRKENHRYRNFYLRQKSCDGILITTTLLLVISAANLRHQAATPFHLPGVHAAVPAPAYSNAPAVAVKPAKKASFFKEVKTALVKSFQKARHYYKAISTRDKILLTALLALLAAAAMYGVIAWACSLSCSGSEAVGWIVLIAGTGAVLFLVFWAARAINRAYRRRRERHKEPQSNG